MKENREICHVDNKVQKVKGHDAGAAMLARVSRDRALCCPEFQRIPAASGRLVPSVGLAEAWRAVELLLAAGGHQDVRLFCSQTDSCCFVQMLLCDCEGSLQPPDFRVPPLLFVLERRFERRLVFPLIPLLLGGAAGASPGPNMPPTRDKGALAFSIPSPAGTP